MLRGGPTTRRSVSAPLPQTMASRSSKIDGTVGDGRATRARGTRATDNDAKQNATSGSSAVQRQVQASLIANRSSRTDHLGLPLPSGSNRQKFKYARTYTIMYDSEKEHDLREEKQWQLLKDTKKVMDMSLEGLHRLYMLFFETVKSPEQSLVGPSTFRMVVTAYGIRDSVLLKRLFCEFCEQADRINYRDFMRVLVSVNEEPVEARLGLLFEIWDMDQSRSLSYSELSGIMLSGIPAHELEAVTEQFNKVWNEMRSSLQGTDDWIGLSRASGLSKDDLVGACQKLSHVRDFFERRLTRRSPQVGETHHTSFQVRLRELQAEVIKESRAEEKKEQERSMSSQSIQRSSSKTLTAMDSAGQLGRASHPKLGAPGGLTKYKQQAADRFSTQIGPSAQR